MENANLLKVQITTFAENNKNSVHAENNKSFIYMLFKLYVQALSRLPNSTMVGHFFVGSLCAMTLFSGLGIGKLTH